MAVKNYAVQIKHITPFPKSYSVMAEVYGFYDKDDPSVLHQIEPSLVNLDFAHDSKIIGSLAPKIRLLVPALGVAATGRDIKSNRKGTETIHRMVGVHSAHIEVLNLPELKEDVVKKSEVSRVMLGAEIANEGFINRIFAKAKAWI